MKTKLILFLLFLSLLVGLWVFRVHSSDPSRTAAIAAAKKEVRSRGWKLFTVEFIEFEGHRWSITLERFPRVLGGHATVEISQDGKVIAYHAGK